MMKKIENNKSYLQQSAVSSSVNMDTEMVPCTQGYSAALNRTSKSCFYVLLGGY